MREALQEVDYDVNELVFTIWEKESSGRSMDFLFFHLVTISCIQHCTLDPQYFH